MIVKHGRVYQTAHELAEAADVPWNKSREMILAAGIQPAFEEGGVDHYGPGASARLASFNNNFVEADAGRAQMEGQFEDAAGVATIVLPDPAQKKLDLAAARTFSMQAITPDDWGTSGG